MARDDPSSRQPLGFFEVSALLVENPLRYDGLALTGALILQPVDGQRAQNRELDW